MEPDAQRMCDIARPATGLQAKFSLRLNAALAVFDENTAAPQTYSDATAGRTDLAALRDRVQVRFMPQDWPRMTAAVHITTRDGRTLEGRHDSSVPDTDLKHQRERLEQKFKALAEPQVGARRAAEIMRAIGALEHMKDVGELMSLLRQSRRTVS